MSPIVLHFSIDNYLHMKIILYPIVFIVKPLIISFESVRFICKLILLFYFSFYSCLVVIYPISTILFVF